MFKWERFEIATLKTLENIQKNVKLHDYSLQPTRTKKSTTDIFPEVLKKERIFDNSKISKKKTLQNYFFFSKVKCLQSRISGFNENRFKENLIPDCSEIVKGLSGKGL